MSDKSMTRSIDVAILNNSMGHSKVQQIIDALNKSSYSQPLNGTQQGPTKKIDDALNRCSYSQPLNGTHQGPTSRWRAQ